MLLNCGLGNNFYSSLCRNSSSFISQKICLQIEGECRYVKSQLKIYVECKFALHKLVVNVVRMPYRCISESVRIFYVTETLSLHREGEILN